jgi:CRISPR system Cascade subunit CasA
VQPELRDRRGISKQGNASTTIPNFTNGPLVAAAVTLLRGDTLFETLWLNLTVYDAERPVPSDPEDAPSWERTPLEPHCDTTEPRGYLDYLTWQSRTIRLHPEEIDSRVIVRRVSYAQGRRFKPEGIFTDPMFAVARRDLTEPFRPVRFNEFRDLWRESAAWYQLRDTRNGYELAPTSVRTIGAVEVKAALPHTTRLRISVSGLCINSQQAADVLFWRH